MVQRSALEATNHPGMPPPTPPEVRLCLAVPADHLFGFVECCLVSFFVSGWMYTWSPCLCSEHLTHLGKPHIRCVLAAAALLRGC